ncbi:MAG: hypothetical protein U9Q06_00210 [Nanoarchaeota archaeon]|nr:hypothetical protein [Nanoarchaeota archaeon]
MAMPIGVMLQDLADMDIFFYVLPFLLVFALVFAILQKIKLMGGEARDNKGVSAIIAIVVALMALQFDTVPIFFQIIFPKVGIGLSVLLVTIIFVGMFIDFQKYQSAAMVFFGIGGVVAIWILLTSIQDYSWWTGSFWANNISAIIALIIVIVFVIIVISSGPKDSQDVNKGFLSKKIGE